MAYKGMYLWRGLGRNNQIHNAYVSVSSWECLVKHVLIFNFQIDWMRYTRWDWNTFYLVVVLVLSSLLHLLLPLFAVPTNLRALNTTANGHSVRVLVHSCKVKGFRLSEFRIWYIIILRMKITQNESWLRTLNGMEFAKPRPPHNKFHGKTGNGARLSFQRNVSHVGFRQFENLFCVENRRQPPPALGDYERDYFWAV